MTFLSLIAQTIAPDTADSRGVRDPCAWVPVHQDVNKVQGLLVVGDVGKLLVVDNLLEALSFDLLHVVTDVDHNPVVCAIRDLQKVDRRVAGRLHLLAHPRDLPSKLVERQDACSAQAALEDRGVLQNTVLGVSPILPIHLESARESIVLAILREHRTARNYIRHATREVVGDPMQVLQILMCLHVEHDENRDSRS